MIINIIFMKECRKMFNIKKYDYVPDLYDLIDFPPESNEKELYNFVKDFQIKYPKCDLINQILF